MFLQFSLLLKNCFNTNVLVIIVLCFALCLNLSSQNKISLIKLTSSNRTKGECFGWTSKISDEYAFVGTGQTSLMIKGKFHQESGSVTIFKRYNNTWKFHQKVFNDDSKAFDFFGGDIYVLDNYLAIGAKGDDDTLDKTSRIRNGSVSIYKLNAKGMWDFNQKLKLNSNQSNYSFGKDVLLKNKTLVTNAINEPYSLINSTGSVYIYNRDSANNWHQIQKIEPPESNLKFFGYNIALNDSLLVVSLGDGGKLFVYKLQHNKLYKYLTTIKGKSVDDESFGSSILLLNNLLIVCSVGEYNHNDGLPDDDVKVIENREKKLLGSGAVYVYEIITDNFIFKQKLTAMDNKADLHFGNAIAGNDSVLIIGAFGDRFQNKAIKDNEYVGAAYLFKFKNNIWEQVHKIVSPKRATWDKFGFSVDIYNKTFIIGSRFDKEDEYEENPIHAAGSVYIGTISD